MTTRKNLNDLNQMKKENIKISALTAYDATMAQQCELANIDLLLVGDSLGMVIQGHQNTTQVTLKDLVYHTKCVVNGCQSPVIMADLPFESMGNEVNIIQASIKLIQSGAQIIKIECGAWLANTISYLKNIGIPSCVHLGLKPQSINLYGKFARQATKKTEQELLKKEVQILEAAGASMLLLECVPTDLCAEITSLVNIPVIAIGSGIQADGQILVIYDVLGISVGYIPKFAKNFMVNNGSINSALSQYNHAIKTLTFPMH